VVKIVEKESKGIRVTKVLKKIHQVVKQRMEEHFKDSNLTVPQGMLIGILAHHGEMKVSDLSEKLGLSNSTVSGIIDRLERQGVVERVRSSEDRRIVYISLSDSAKKNSQKYYENINNTFDKILDKATREELEVILKGLDTLEIVMERNRD
jgi:MarR family transcriptional regulator, organic hydroperoxide resistance regulator